VSGSPPFDETLRPSRGSTDDEGHPGTTRSDAALIHQMNAGSTAAFGELYDRHQGQALRVARSYCANAAGAEEAVQDAFESIWRSRGTYRAERGPVVAWAMAIVRYRALAIVKARGRDAYGLVDVLPEASSAPEKTGDDAVAADDAEHLLNLLERIPPAQREVIALAFFGQLTHTEIAEHLGLPAGTVKGRMRLGLDKLRTDLEREMS
jgi:RNA polymerase sigma-70 factor (ECF subfamily)